jgi:TetR/AcrR family transcriptional regulator
MSAASPPRLSAPERRQALVATALKIFSARSYRGVTTAEIAREAGVSEPILYRHFASKRELYLACIEEAWQQLRRGWEAAIEESHRPSQWLPAMAKSGIVRQRSKGFLAHFWIQAITEAPEDAEIRTYLRGHVREVHDFVADRIRRCQEAGGIPLDRDADAEAWIFLAGGLLATFTQRLGGILSPEDFGRIMAARRRWMTPDAAD